MNARLDHSPCYFPVGLPPLQRDPREHAAHVAAAKELMAVLNANGERILLVANPCSNFMKGDHAGPEQARATALSIAQQEQVFWRALAAHCDTNISVGIMSQEVDQAAFDQLHEDLWILLDNNADFQAAVADCIPKCMETGNVQKQRRRMDYVLQQIAFVILLGGSKLGHDGEVVYNHATAMAARLLGEQCPDFKRDLQRESLQSTRPSKQG